MITFACLFLWQIFGSKNTAHIRASKNEVPKGLNVKGSHQDLAINLGLGSQVIAFAAVFLLLTNIEIGGAGALESFVPWRERLASTRSMAC